MDNVHAVTFFLLIVAQIFYCHCVDVVFPSILYV